MGAIDLFHIDTGVKIQQKRYICKKNKMTNSETAKILSKGIFTGTIEKDADGNYHCGEILLDYKMVSMNFNLGDLVTIKNVITNPSDISFAKYAQKSKNFAIANLKSEN